MANTISVTKCDNELIILAYQWGGSFEICRVLSGNNNPVNVNIAIASGLYQGGQVLNGVNQPLNQNITVTLPSGVYSLLLLGVDWGGPEQFTVNVNNVPYVLPYGNNNDGLVFKAGPISITV